MRKIKKRLPKKYTETTITVQARLSYVHLTEPWSGSEGNEKKYSVSCIIPKYDKETIQAIRDAIDAALKEGTTKYWRGKRPNPQASSFKYPLKDGDVERPDDKAYAECMYFGANSKNKVPTYNNLQEIISPEEIYSGCWGLVKVNFFPFDNASKGVAAGLESVLKIANDERLGGGNTATASDFDGFDLDEDDEEDDVFD